MQGLADGYFVLPYTIANYLASAPKIAADEDHPAAKEAVQEVKSRIETFLSIKGSRSPDSFHRELGLIMWENCGMARTEAGLKSAIEKIKNLRDEFWKDLRVLGTGDELNVSLEKAGRV